MKSTHLLGAACTFAVTLGFNTAANAFFLDFEDGVDGNPVSDIAGVSFLDFNGYDSLYADCRTSLYNCTSDDLGYSMLSGAYHHNGNFAVWAGPNADAQGMIVDFDNNDGTYLRTGYSAYTSFIIDAILTDGSVVTVTGAANTGGPMDFLQVNATGGLFIDYVVLHDTGNYWIIDDMSGDASGVTPPSVPVPPAVWLFGSGLLGLIGVSKRKKSA